MFKEISVAAFLPLMLVLSGCGGSAASASWETGKDVLDSLEEAGFECSWAGAGDQISTEDSSSESFIAEVNCDEYRVTLYRSLDEYMDDLVAAGRETVECAGITDEWSDMERAEAVVGKNFLVEGTVADGDVPGAWDGEFPGAAQPEDFVKAFGGEIKTAAELFAPMVRELCPDAPIG